ncbi:MAG: ComF family protein [Lachnospiraceae bacterium]|nr:ComF family protein [Lachnospiraceae bacterium]
MYHDDRLLQKSNKRSSFIDGFLHIIFPARCPGCDKVHPIGVRGFCESCRNDLREPEGKLCPYCGKPIQEEEDCCRECRKVSHDFIAGEALWLYTGRLQESMARFKQGKRAEYGEVYGELLWQKKKKWIQSIGQAVLVPVPIYKNRLQRRGYNQAELIAAKLSECAGLPMAENLLIRQRDTKPQKELSRQERRENIRGAFVCGKEASHWLYSSQRCAIIVDDIYTTGSTVDACASVLREVGFEKIFFLCVCVGKTM